LLLNDIKKRNKFLSLIPKSEKENNSLLFTLAINEEKFSKLIPDNIESIIKNKGENFIISGTKKNVLCGSVASYFTLLARFENSDRFTLILVPSNYSGIEISQEKHKLGLKICPVNDVTFNDVEIFKENILEHIKLSDLLNYYKFFDGCLASIAVGMAEEAYNIALKYTTERYQGGKIICEHDAVKLLLSDMALSIETAKNLVYSVRKKTPLSLSNGVYNSSNIISSAYASDIAEKVCIDAIQLLGGYGYMKDFKIERVLRDAKTYQAIINPHLRKMEYINHQIERVRHSENK
jgi:alkylation response protein AidB-like acyl-CoA dehydrogenase